jgi:chorismate mutase-like protein
LSFALLALGCGGCATDHAGSAKGSAALGKLMVERLGWMDGIALVKRVALLPITDAKREAEVLQAMEKRGAEAGLPRIAVRSFFAGQMQAAKERQNGDQVNVYATSVVVKPEAAKAYLTQTARPALDRIGNEMIAALVQARASGDKRAVMESARRQLVDHDYSQAVIELAMHGLEAGLKP